MNYKELFKISMSLISSPAKAWEEIRLEEDRRKVFGAFVYPMIGLCGLAVFIGSLLVNGWGGPQSFQIAMTQCCAVAVALFGGYFLAAYAINQLRVQMFGMSDDVPLTQQFAGYALVVTFLLKIITGLLPDFSIIGKHNTCRISIDQFIVECSTFILYIYRSQFHLFLNLILLLAY